MLVSGKRLLLRPKIIGDGHFPYFTKKTSYSYELNKQ